MPAQNAYPNPAEYPTPSFKVPVTAPDVDPDEGAVVVIGLNPEWIPVVEGALDQLMLPSSWKGDHDQVITALNRSDVLKMLVGSATVGEAPAPYWDEESDADDELPIDEQPWYGRYEEETFIDQIAWWILTGFLAVTFTPHGAIVFITIVRRFRIQFIRHGIGGVIKIALNGDTYAEIDTYSEDESVGYVDVIVPDDEGFRAFDVGTSLSIEMADFSNPLAGDTPSINLIRGELAPGDVYPTNLRFNSSTGHVQKTYDDGGTWVNYDDGDPRTSSVFLRPGRTGTDRRCDTAANAVKWLKDFIDGVIALLAAAATALELATFLLKFLDLLAEYAILFDLVLSAAGDIAAVGDVALTAAFTSTQYDILLCILYCNMDADGGISDAAFTEIQAEITAQMNTTAGIVTNLLFQTQGRIGVQNAGRIGTESGDCSGCTGCTHTLCIDFGVQDGSAYGLVAVQSTTPANTVWSSGLGWVGGFNNTNSKNNATLDLIFPSTVTLISATWTYDKTGGSGANNINNARVTNPHTAYNVTQVAIHSSATLGVNKTNAVAYAGTAKGASLDINSGTVGASVVVRKLEIKYTGPIPAGWSDNC